MRQHAKLIQFNLILVLDHNGNLNRIIKDDYNFTVTIKNNSENSNEPNSNSQQKLKLLIYNIIINTIEYNWEFELDLKDSKIALYLSGLYISDHIIIVGTLKKEITKNDILCDIINIFNEICQTLLEAPKSDILDKNMISRGVREYIIEMSKLNNELVNTHRELEKQKYIINIQRDNLELLVKNRTAELQNALSQLHSELDHRKEIETALIIAKTRVEEAYQIKNIFLENLSHELLTPLNAVVGFSEILLEESFLKDNKEISSQLREIYANAKKIEKMIKTLLELTQLDSGQSIHSNEAIAIYSLIENCTKEFLPIITEKKMEISIQVENSVKNYLELLISANKEQIKRVFSILLDNAIKYSSSNGKCGILINQSGSDVIITVWDTGIGIENSNLGKLFQPFQFIENIYSKNFQGIGISLYIAKRIVEANHGKIWVESSFGVGTKFFVSLPIFKVK